MDAYHISPAQQAKIDKAISNMEVFEDYRLDKGHSNLYEKHIYASSWCDYRREIMPFVRAVFRNNLDRLAEIDAIKGGDNANEVNMAVYNYSVLSRLYKDALEVIDVVRKEQIVDIFISHSRKDKELVDRFVDLLIHSIKGIDKSKIRCTSVDGCSLKPGSESAKCLQEDIFTCRSFVPIITINMLQSIYAMFECGARWTCNKEILAVVVHPDGIKSLSEPFTFYSAVPIQRVADIANIIEGIGRDIQSDLNPNSGYQDKMDNLLKYIKKAYYNENS